MSCGLVEINGPVQGGSGTAFHAVAAQAKALAQAAFNIKDAAWAQTRASAQNDLAGLADPVCDEHCEPADTGQGIDEVRDVGEPRRRRGAAGFECSWWSTATAYKWVECREEDLAAGKRPAKEL